MRARHVKLQIIAALVLGLISVGCQAENLIIVNPGHSRIKTKRKTTILYKVKQGLPKKPHRGYRNNGNGTLIDYKTSLMWQEVPAGNVRTWTESKNYAKKLKTRRTQKLAFAYYFRAKHHISFLVALDQ